MPQPSIIALTPEELEILKRELMEQTHVALPGTVESFDPATQTASVRPALRRTATATGQPVRMPLLQDVPVFFPGSKTAGITWPVQPGDECLVVFVDNCIDGWFTTGNETLPPSTRQHDLSDAFAFVGFRSRPNALQGISSNPSFFGVDVGDIDPGGGGGSGTVPHHTHQAEDLLSLPHHTHDVSDITGGGSGVVPQHTHDAGDITTGAIPIAHGGTGQTSAAQGLIALGGVTAGNETPAAGSGVRQLSFEGSAFRPLVSRLESVPANGSVTLGYKVPNGTLVVCCNLQGQDRGCLFVKQTANAMRKVGSFDEVTITSSDNILTIKNTSGRIVYFTIIA